MLLIGIGVIAVAAASPAAAHRYSGGSVHVGDLFYLKRQILWVLAGVPVMLGVSMLPIVWAKRLALGGTMLFIAALFAVPFIGVEANGAVRWIALPGFQFQPSEFLKPVFIVTTAWLLAARFEDPRLPTMQLSFGLLLVVGVLLIKQPDFGQTALFFAVWGCQAVLAGMGLTVLGVLLGLAAAGMGIAYLTSDHVAQRIDHFIKGTGDTYQIDRALDCFKSGGIFGAGPGEGQMKFRLPRGAHRLYLLGDRRGVRRDRLLPAGAAVPRDRRARTAPAARRGGAVRVSRRRRPRRAVWPAGDDQHGGQPQPAAVEGHDAAVRQPRRVVVPCGLDRHGAAAGDDPAQSVSEGVALCGAGRGAAALRMTSFVVAAGGTGGHMVPASVLAAELTQRGHRVVLMSDERGLRFPGLFDGVETRVVASASIGGRNPVEWLKGLYAVARGRSEAKAFLRAEHVAAVIGFGGYPAVPALLAAFALGVPTILHEQNAVFGRSNRLLAGRVRQIAASFAGTQRLPERYAGKTEVIGNPVREKVLTLGDVPFRAPAAGEPLRLLVTGGSQGASILSRVVPAAVALLPAETRAQLVVVHQGRPDDLAAARAAYAEAGVAAELASYLPDLPARIAAAHLVIARSGASTMAELAVIGRPAILVPYGAATDDHQTANAAEFIAAGAGMLIAETAFTPANVATAIVSLTTHASMLANAARAAKTVGRPQAGARLADMAVALGKAA